MRRVLVVGSGSIAKRHIKNFRSLYPKVETVCVSASGRTLHPSEVGANKVEHSIQRALSKPLDLAIIASPAPLHLDNAHQVAHAGVPVLIEKPLCKDVTEFYKYDFHNQNYKIGVAYNLRYLPAAKIAKKFLNQEKLGKILSVDIECGQFLPDWRPGTDYRKGVSAQKKLGGGALLELSHELDYLLWIFGSIDSVSAKLENTKTLDIDVEDSVTGLLKSSAGFFIRLHLDLLQRKPCRRLRVVCESGNLVWDLMENKVSIENEINPDKVIFRDPSYDKNDMYINQLIRFIDFANGKADFESNITSALAVMKLMDAIRKSSNLNTWVDVH